MKNKLLPVVMLLSLAVLTACGGPTPQAATPSAQVPSATTAAPTTAPTEPATPTLQPTAPQGEPVGEPAPLPLTDLTLFSDGSGWATDRAGSRIYHTSDSGLNWQEVSPALAGSSVAYSTFLDGQTGWAVFSQIETSARLFATTDGGAHWTTADLDFPGGQLYFLDAQNGFMLASLGVGAGSEYVALYATQDGGASWEQRFSHTPGGAETSLPSGGIKNGLFFIDQNNGWVTGSAPISDSLYLYATTDGGTSWSQGSCSGLPTDAAGTYFEPLPPYALPDGTLILPVRALIGSSSTATLFCASQDNGASWSLRSTANFLAQATARSADGSLFAYDESHLFSSTDGALTWQDLSASLPTGYLILDVARVDALTARMVVTNEVSLDAAQNWIFESADGAETWQLLPAQIAE